MLYIKLEDFKSGMNDIFTAIRGGMLEGSITIDTAHFITKTMSDIIDRGMISDGEIFKAVCEEIGDNRYI